MNVGFHYRGVDTEFLAVFQTELDGSLDHGLIDGLHRGRGESVEGAIEGVVLRDAMAVKLGKAAQRVAVVDTFAQFPIVPVFDAHEDERAQGLGGRDAATAGGGVFESALQILAHLIDQLGMLAEEIDALQGGIEMDALWLNSRSAKLSWGSGVRLIRGSGFGWPSGRTVSG